VIILDISTRAFDRLPGTFRGNTIRGNGTDEDVLRRAGVEGADLFVALTEGDNRNVMAAQLALEALGVKQVIAKINDPVRAEAYSHLGIPTLCRTNLMADVVFGFVGMPLTGTEPIMTASGHHPGGEEHHAPTATPTQPVGSADGLIATREAY
jgi:trk system potassium uptake protein TrkA